MGILSGIFKVRDKPENRTAGSAYTFYMGGSTSGKNVTERSVMQMTVAFFSISFLVLRRWVSFWRALYSLRVTVSPADTLIKESCFPQLLIVLRFTPYSRSSCGYEILPALCKSTICCLNSGV